jgi:hypothetical protein
MSSIPSTPREKMISVPFEPGNKEGEDKRS